MSNTSLRQGVLIGYATGSIGTGIFSTVPSVLLLYYLTDALGLAPAYGAVIVFLPKILALVTDPLTGTLSDRTRSRWGRRRPWLLGGALLLTFTFIFLFRAPADAGAGVKFAWTLGIYALTATAYSIFAVPYVAMPAELSESAAERARIMAWRFSFVITGVLIGSAGAPPPK